MNKDFDYYIDRKYTIWARERYLIKAASKDDADKIMNEVFAGKNKDDLSYDFEYLYETSEDMSIEENGGESTMELFESNGNLITTNKK